MFNDFVYCVTEHMDLFMDEELWKMIEKASKGRKINPHIPDELLGYFLVVLGCDRERAMCIQDVDISLMEEYLRKKYPFYMPDYLGVEGGNEDE
ncbi:MAG: hypothetical protein IJ608_04295 [Lachnospiraceae bacterium]|nr:hypothetical protein [Lachnospiraceae bacterium]